MLAKKINDYAFFLQSAEELAPKLLGKIICRKLDDDFIVRCRINVTEAYCQGELFTDATRAEKQGKKNAQHKKGGHLFVKSIRGGFRFDIVANEEGIGEGVLIRGIDPYKEGPMIAADALNIDLDFDSINLLESKEIWLEDDGAIAILCKPTTRVGIDSDKELRFFIKEIKFP